MGGACGWHRRNEIHAGVDSIVSKDMRATAWKTQVAASKRVRVAPPDSIVRASAAASKRVRVAPPDSIVRASAGSTARNTWNECG